MALMGCRPEALLNANAEKVNQRATRRSGGLSQRISLHGA
jgi:hypothetical protein